MRLSFALLPAALLTTVCLSFNQSRNFSKDARHAGADSTIEHKGKSITSKMGAVQLSSGLDNDFYQLDSVNRTGYLYLEAKLDKFLNERATRIPLNIAIVIDHSGSMAGDKMENAKKAAKEIVNKLTADDFVSVVIYDSGVELIQASVRAIDKTPILEKIEKIKDGSSTNLWGGTEKGYEQVKTNYKKNYLNRVLLISDGLVNEGITSTFEIKKRVEAFKNEEGISLSSFGVGLDYNELLMTDMAETGAGNYYFIEKPDQIAALFEKELNGMLNVVAQNAELKIQLPAGVKLQKVFTFKPIQAGNELVFKMRDLFSEETRGIMIRFSLDEGVSDKLKFTSILSYDDITDNQRKSLVNENFLSPCSDYNEFMVYQNEEVKGQTVLYIANENLEKAMLAADQGKFEEARTITAGNASFMSANSLYGSRASGFIQMDSINKQYYLQLQNGEKLSTDSLRYMQKAGRAESYKIRSKKNN
ncbi:MAG TPA: VWA domain-containing protein [Chitinophagaceae bacterium]|nr:VWA domain-containing protein [Chitinophagaceae bacterium]